MNAEDTPYVAYLKYRFQRLEDQQVSLATAVADLKSRTEAGFKAGDREVFGLHQRINAASLRMDGLQKRLDRDMLEKEEAYRKRQEALKVLILVLLFMAGVLAGVLFS